MPRGYPEEPDPRTGKAPKHSEAASKGKSDISNAEIISSENPWDEFYKLLKEGKIEEASALQVKLKKAEKEKQMSELSKTEKGEKVVVIEVESVFGKTLVYYKIKTRPNGKGFDVWSRREDERWKKITKKGSFYAYQTFDEMIKLVSTVSPNSDLEVNRRVINIE